MKQPLRQWTHALSAISLIALLCSACSISSTIDMGNAEDALATARSVGAEYKAPFEYYMAREMFRKAREEWGYAEYYQSTQYAEKAMEYAEKARHKSQSDPWKPPPPEVMGLPPAPKPDAPAPTPAPAPTH